MFHSEFNPSSNESVHFLQIWIIPETKDLKPGWEQKTFSDEHKEENLLLIGSQDGRQGSIAVHQDINLYRSCLKEGQDLYFPLFKERGCWIQLMQGEIQINGHSLLAGDGAQIVEEAEIHINAVQSAELLVFDLK